MRTSSLLCPALYDVSLVACASIDAQPHGGDPNHIRLSPQNPAPELMRVRWMGGKVREGLNGVERLEILIHITEIHESILPCREIPTSSIRFRVRRSLGDRCGTGTGDEPTGISVPMSTTATIMTGSLRPHDKYPRSPLQPNGLPIQIHRIVLEIIVETRDI